MNGKVTVKVEGGGWQRLGGKPLSRTDYEVSAGAYHFQIQRFSTPNGSPSGDAKVSVSNKEQLASSVREIFSLNPFHERIPVIHEDETINNLVGFFNATGSDNEDVSNIATLLAMPGSGKTRSIKEAAAKAGAVHKRVRIDASWSDYDDGTDVVQIVRGHLMRAIGIGSLPGIWSQQVVVHFDEVQVFLSFENGPKKLQTLAEVCNSIIYSGDTALTWLKFVFTGTNINAHSPIRLGSSLKAEPISITGSFPFDFVIRLFTDYIDAPTEEHVALLERCRHNRRVTERFLRHAWDHRKGSQELSAYYELARNHVAASISSQLDSKEKVTSPLACRVLRLVLQAISEGRTTSIGQVKLLTLRVDESSQDLDYVRGGGLNVFDTLPGGSSDAKKDVRVYYPEGCVIEILSMLSCRAVLPKTITDLLSFLYTSRVKTFNLGWFFEALIVHDLCCADSEFEALLQLGKRQNSIFNTVAIRDQPQLWKAIPAATAEQILWWVRDEMNSHQDRWIDIAYRQEDAAIVIVESKSGVSSQGSGPAEQFFRKAVKLARKYPTMNWIAVYACFRSPGDDAMGATEEANLTKRMILVDERNCPFLAGVFAIAKEADDEQLDALAQDLKSQAVISPSAPNYSGGTPSK